MDSSNLKKTVRVSQTQLEQRDLLQYECNLAACYEAEYLLSLKIQEDMCQERDAYNDPSEVTQCRTAAMLDTAAALSANDQLGVYRISTHLAQETDMDCSANLATSGNNNFYGFVNPSQTVQLGEEGAAASSGLYCHGQEQQLAFAGRERGDMETAEGDGFYSEAQVTHPDGPCRKRACLNRVD